MSLYSQFDDLEFHRDFENLKSLETLININYYNISSKISMINKIKNNYHSVEDMNEIYSTEEEKRTFKDRIKLFFQKISEFLKKIIERIVHFGKTIYYKYLLFLKKIGLAKGTSFHYLSEDEFKLNLNSIFNNSNDPIIIPKIKYPIRYFKKELDKFIDDCTHYIHQYINNCVHDVTNALNTRDNEKISTLFDKYISELTDKNSKYIDILESMKKCKEFSKIEMITLTPKTTSKEFYKKFDQVYMNEGIRYVIGYENYAQRFKSLLDDLKLVVERLSLAMGYYEEQQGDDGFDTNISNKYFKFDKIFLNFVSTINNSINTLYNLFNNIGKGYRLIHKLYEVRN